MPDAQYPMYVLPVSVVQALDRLPTHEEARLTRQMREWAPGMTTLFVSQTWLANAHPDNGRNEKAAPAASLPAK